MKLTSLLFLVTVSASAANTFGIRSKTATHRSQLPKALAVRGGDLKDNLVTTATALEATHGILSLAAPEVVPKVLYQGTFDIEEGSTAELWQEHVGSSLLGIALMTYLAANTDVSATDNVVWSAGSCAYVFFRRLIKGSYENLGFSKAYTTVCWITFLTIPVLGAAILSDKYDTTLLAKIYVALPALMGITHFVSPDTMKSFAGLEEKQDAVGDSIMDWWHSALIVWSTLAYSLVDGSDVYEAVGRAAVVFGLMVIDYNFVRKQNAALNLTDATKVIFPLVQLVIGAGLLKPAAVASAAEK